MTYAQSQEELGKEPITIAVLQVDACSLTYSVGPCTASLSAGNECYNTRGTCQDPDNYDKTTKDYTFCSSRANLPQGVNMFPAIVGDIAIAPTSITGGKGLGNRAVVNITLNDFTHSDRGIDPYWETRAAGGEESGTFWGKWLARNQYYEGRTLIVKHGYMAEPWDDTLFESTYYDIDKIMGPDKGKLKIVAKDILTRTYARKARYPAATNGVLSADLTTVATSLTLTPTGVGNDEYPASGYGAMGKEIVSFTRSGDVFTIARAKWGSSAEEASEDDTFQLCVSWTNANVLDALEEILETGASIPPSYIPNGVGENWTDERELWMGNFFITGIITEPTPVEDTVAEWSNQYMFDIWWNAVDQEIDIKALSPEPSGVTIDTLSDGYNLLADSVKVKKDPKQRVTTVLIHYNKINSAESDDPENFSKHALFADISAEGSDKYNESSIREITSKWIASDSYANQYGGRTLARFLDTPILIEFDIDAKDDTAIDIAGRVAIDSKAIQDVAGANKVTNFQITEVRPKKEGDIIAVKALISSFTGRYGFIAPNGLSDYSSESEANTDAYAFVGEAGGADFSDGEPPYKII